LLRVRRGNLVFRILVVPHALGQRVSFVEGEGPRLEALNDPTTLQRLRPAIDHAVLEPVYETITRVRQVQGTPDQSPAHLFAYRHPDVFAKLIDALVDASASYL
jgi:uroporphyrinogen decarboxylase